MIENLCGRIHNTLLEIDGKAEAALAAAHIPGPQGPKGDAGPKGDTGTYRIVIKDANYMASAWDVILGDTSIVGFTVGLPSGVPNAVVIIKKISKDKNHLTLVGIIDGVSNPYLIHQWDYFTIISDGINWYSI